MSIHQLTLKQLRALEAVYHAGKVSTAADSLNVTQSAVSVLIRQVETVLGVTLFDRTTRSLVPTVACENAIGVVERVLGDIRLLDETLRDIRDLNRGIVRLTTTPATGLAILPATVRRFRRTYPAVDIVIDDCAPNQFLTNIRTEKVDFGVGIGPSETSEFAAFALTQDPLCAVLPMDHPCAHQPEMDWADLAGAPLILSRRDYGVRDLVETTLQQVNVRPHIAAEVGFLSSTTWMVGAGIGVCVLPERLAVLYRDDGIAVVRLRNPVVLRPISLVTKKDRSLSPANRRFVDMLQADFAAAT